LPFYPGDVLLPLQYGPFVPLSTAPSLLLFIFLESVWLVFQITTTLNERICRPIGTHFHENPLFPDSPPLEEMRFSLVGFLSLGPQGQASAFPFTPIRSPRLYCGCRETLSLPHLRSSIIMPLCVFEKLFFSFFCISSSTTKIPLHPQIASFSKFPPSSGKLLP